MARLTVEDCLKEIPNRFELILEASKRARQIAKGSEPVVEWDNDKPTVVALREIAEGNVGLADEVAAKQEAEAEFGVEDVSLSVSEEVVEIEEGNSEDAEEAAEEAQAESTEEAAPAEAQAADEAAPATDDASDQEEAKDQA